MRPVKDIVKEWASVAEFGDVDEFLDYAQGLNINGFVIEDGVRTIWIEDGVHYIAHGYVIRETDSEDAKTIMDTLEECGLEFEAGIK